MAETYSAVYPNSSTGVGLIYDISSMPNVPWYSIDDDYKKSLEVAYLMRSGNKRIYDSFLTLSNEVRASVVLASYFDKWRKYYELYNLEYEPLSAYIVEEVGNRKKTNDRSRTTNYGRVEDETNSNTGTISDSGNSSNAVNNSVYGFNSVISSPSDDSSDSSSTQNTETRNLENARKLTNSGSDFETIDDSEVEDYNVSKRGNIGYSTPQKLISGEFEIWQHPFFQIVFRDIDKLIMLKIYN